MAVGRSGEFFEDLHPPTPGFLAADGEFEGGFATGAAPHGGAREEPPAQGAQFAAFELAESPLEQCAEVVGGDGQVVQRLGRPEATAAQTPDAKLRSQFLDPVLPAPSGAALRAKAPPFGYFAPLSSMSARPL